MNTTYTKHVSILTDLLLQKQKLINELTAIEESIKSHSEKVFSSVGEKHFPTEYGFLRVKEITKQNTSWKNFCTEHMPKAKYAFLPEFQNEIKYLDCRFVKAGE